MKRKPTILIILMALLVAATWLRTTTALAQTGGPYDLSWSTIDSGGQPSAGGSYWLDGTAGQFDASGPLTGGSFELTGGFWAVENGPPTAVTLASFTATPQAGGILIAWETAIEIDTMGFNVYRVQSPENDWTRLNDTLIPSASPGSVWGGDYSYVDSDVIPGTTYYYKLEELEVGGGHNWYGPVSTDGDNPTSVTLFRATAGRTGFAALAWWLAGMAVVIGAGLVAARWIRKRSAGAG